MRLRLLASVAIGLSGLPFVLDACSSRGEDEPPFTVTPSPEASDEGGLDAGVDLDAADEPEALDCTPTTTGAPLHLGCTGLYAAWPDKTTLAPGVAEYDPGLRLWSDGAEKTRWIYLPPGTTIDTTDMDEWVFPVGTKLWKQFVVGGKRIETRLLLKKPDGKWIRTLYLWNEGESDAVEYTQGIRPDGGGYEVPSTEQCRLCHNGRIDGVLGFDAVSLSSPQAAGLTMAQLVSKGLVTVAPEAGSLAIPGGPVDQAALGWLHANCGTPCHSPSPNSQANFTAFYMRLNAAQLGSVAATDTYRTGVNAGSAFQLDGGPPLLRIAPGDVSRSAMVLRASVRDAKLEIQMPPILSHVVDDAGVGAITTWVQSLP